MDKIYFTYERMEPIRYPEPRDIRMILQKKCCSIYKDVNISNIPYSTEIIIKSIKSENKKINSTRDWIQLYKTICKN